jgi:molybdopterin-binding protein
MNILPGVISDVQSTTHMSYVKVHLNEHSFIKTVLLETPDTLSYLKPNEKVKVLFKETEVILSAQIIEAISLENSLSGVIKKIDQGEILTRVELETSSGNVTSIVTTESFNKLKLNVEDSIVASINSSEIMLAE